MHRSIGRTYLAGAQYLWKVPGFRCYNLQELLHDGNFYKLVKKCTLTSFVALWMLSERNAPKNGERTVGFSFTTMLQHTGRF